MTTITMTDELKSRLSDALFAQLEYQINESCEPAEYYTEDTAYLDTLDLLGFDTDRLRNDFWERVTDQDRENTKEYLDALADVPELDDFRTEFAKRCLICDIKTQLTDYFGENAADYAPTEEDIEELAKRVSQAKETSSKNDKERIAETIEAYVAESLGRS